MTQDDKVIRHLEGTLAWTSAMMEKAEREQSMCSSGVIPTVLLLIGWLPTSGRTTSEELLPEN